MTKVFYTKDLANKKKTALKVKIDDYLARGLRPPHLEALIVGDDPASKLYVSMKRRECEKIGMSTNVTTYPTTTATKDVLERIQALNNDKKVDGILIQLPLPTHLDKNAILESISARKDIDGLTPVSQGLLALGRPGFIPCTPKGIMEILKDLNVEMAGMSACVVGRSTLVGGPVAKLLSQQNATVTVVHSFTNNPQEIARSADVLIVAVGQKNLVDDKWVKKGAVVIDVGIHHDGPQILGDCNQEKISGIASVITPVPGGVGPMTIACLLENCVDAYEGFLAASAT